MPLTGKEKILLDTDIGSDIDDSLCLAYLLRQPLCELLGITTVSGDALNRAKIASAVCKAAGRDIPIYPGAEQPLLTPQKQPSARQAGKLMNWAHDTDFPPQGEAFGFMRKIIRENPHEVTLLGIGPMTNIALLFATDPEIPGLLKQLVLMCGAFTYRYKGDVCLSEWNARCDPYAAAVVYRAPVRKIMSIGLDVTSKVVLEKDEIIKSFTSGILKTILDFSGILENTHDSITFHDPLAAAAIFNAVCRFEKGNVDIEIGSVRLEGLTYWQPDEKGRNEVAFEVDREKFFEHFFSVVG